MPTNLLQRLSRQQGDLLLLAQCPEPVDDMEGIVQISLPKFDDVTISSILYVQQRALRRGRSVLAVKADKGLCSIIPRTSCKVS